jgi:hypothetical protein
MYIADLFNTNNLFQNFGGWFQETKVSFFSRMMKSKEKDIKKILESWKLNVQGFETLLGFATSVILTINQIKNLEQKCVQQFEELKEKLDLRENRIIFWSHKLVNLLSKISLVINIIGIMENLLLELIGKKVKHPMPKNMFILIKNGHKSYNFLQLKLWNRIEAYWQNTGKYLRAYKNIERYLFSLTTHSYIEINPKEKLLILLPDNPEMEISYKFVYEKNVDAIRFLENSFNDFHNLVEDISMQFDYNPTHILQGWSFLEYQYLPAKSGTVALVIKNPEKRKAVEVINEGGKPIFNKLSLHKNEENAN